MDIGKSLLSFLETVKFGCSKLLNEKPFEQALWQKRDTNVDGRRSFGVLLRLDICLECIDVSRRDSVIFRPLFEHHFNLNEN